MSYSSLKVNLILKIDYEILKNELEVYLLADIEGVKLRGRVENGGVVALDGY